AMFFQNDHGHTCSREQVASHDPGWSTACDHTTRLQFFSHAFSIEYGSNWYESKYAAERTRSCCVYLQRGSGYLRYITTGLLGLFRTSNGRTSLFPEWLASAGCLLRSWSVGSASCGGSRTRGQRRRS